MRFKTEKFRVYNLMRVLCMVMLLGAANAFAQNADAAKTEPAETPAAQGSEKPAGWQPVLTEYKGVKIGMTAEEVRQKLNEKPEVADKDGFYYVFSDNESAQIMLDGDKKVRVIVVMYKNSTGPKYEDVFGKDVPLAETPDGRIYNRIHYEDAGFWVAYNRTAGDNSFVTVTIQKL